MCLVGCFLGQVFAFAVLLLLRILSRNAQQHLARDRDLGCDREPSVFWAGHVQVKGTSRSSAALPNGGTLLSLLYMLCISLYTHICITLHKYTVYYTYRLF